MATDPVRDEDAWVIRAFNAEQARELAGLDPKRLWSWDRRAFVSPSHSVRAGRRRRRLYNFRDLVSVRVAADLVAKGVRLPEIRKAVAHLRQLDYEKPLAELTFWEFEGRLYFSESETVRAGRRPEQVLAGFMVPVPEIVTQLKERIRELDKRPVGEIERRRGALGGKPVIKGTRIPVASIRRLAEDGLTDAEIRDTYPDLEMADVQAALAESPPRRRMARTG